MQDFSKIVAGIIIFLVLLSIPVIVTQASGNSDYTPDPQVDMNVVEDFIADNYPYMDYDGECVESTDYMRKNHWRLLFDWRAWAVRDDADGDKGVPYYTATDGDEWFMSLNETCLGCHNDRDTFCNQCHNYTGIRPNCWSCHD